MCLCKSQCRNRARCSSWIFAVGIQQNIQRCAELKEFSFWTYALSQSNPGQFSRKFPNEFKSETKSVALQVHNEDEKSHAYCLLGYNSAIF